MADTGILTPKGGKIVLFGLAGAGKTSIHHRCFLDTELPEIEKMQPTLLMSVDSPIIPFLEEELSFWDLGGQDRFRFMQESYIIGAKGALLMFDLTRMTTLDTIENWVNLLRSKNPDLPILFVGTKNDLADQIMIDDDYASQYMEEYRFFDYIKISSKTGENVHESFEVIVKEIYRLSNA